MAIPSFVIIGKDTEKRRAAVKAAQTASPAARVTTAARLGELSDLGPNPACLAFINPTAKDIAEIRKANIPQLFPEAGTLSGAELAQGRFAILLKGECDGQLLAHIFRAALFQHRILRENARLRGDLRTVAYRVNHDLRTPLGGIITTGEVLKHELSAIASNRLPLVAGVFRSTDEMEQLIGRICFLLRASANPPAISIVRMGEPVMAALQRLEPRIIKENATIVQPESWPEVRGVPAWLEVVWWNLLMNALQHGGSGRIEIGWRKQAEGHEFWVADHGRGVPGAKRSRLFVPFDLLHEPDARSGLGLSIVQRLVDLQGGDCSYQENGGGSRFLFTLPLAVGMGSGHRAVIAQK